MADLRSKGGEKEKEKENGMGSSENYGCITPQKANAGG